jgi:hypothetical protein
MAVWPDSCFTSHTYSFSAACPCAYVYYFDSSSAFTTSSHSAPTRPVDLTNRLSFMTLHLVQSTWHQSQWHVQVVKPGCIQPNCPAIHSSFPSVNYSVISVRKCQFKSSSYFSPSLLISIGQCTVSSASRSSWHRHPPVLAMYGTGLDRVSVRFSFSWTHSNTRVRDWNGMNVVLNQDKRGQYFRDK